VGREVPASATVSEAIVEGRRPRADEACQRLHGDEIHGHVGMADLADERDGALRVARDWSACEMARVRR